MRAILRLLAELGFRSIFVARLVHEERLEVLVAHNEPGGCAIPEGLVLPLPEGWRAASAGGVEPARLLTEERRNGPAFADHLAEAAVRLGAPISLSDGRLFGLLCLADPQVRGLTPAQEERLRVTGRLLATRVERDEALAERRRAEEDLARLLTREQAARAAAEAAQGHLAFLAEASALLAASLDFEATLQRVARLAVPTLADCCAVDVLDEDGSVQQLVVAHAEPGKEGLVRELRRRSPPDPEAPYGVAQLLRTGRPQLLPDRPETWQAVAGRDGEPLGLLRALAPRSAMLVVLQARGRTLGALTFISCSPGRRYGRADLALAEELARRCALAIDNARLYDEQRAMVARLRQLRGRVEAADREHLLEEERRRIARELHDRVEQTFFSIGLAADAALRPVDPDPERWRPALATVRRLSAGGAEQVREAIFALGQADVRDRGPVPLLWKLVRDFRARTALEADLVLAGTERRLPPETAEALYAVAREALANVERHACAKAVVVSLSFTPRAVTLAVQDDGDGANPLVLQRIQHSATHFGLRDLRERVRRIAGTFTARPGEGGGFVVRARLPLRGEG